MARTKKADADKAKLPGMPQLSAPPPVMMPQQHMQMPTMVPQHHMNPQQMGMPPPQQMQQPVPQQQQQQPQQQQQQQIGQGMQRVVDVDHFMRVRDSVSLLSCFLFHNAPTVWKPSGKSFALLPWS